MDNTTTIVLAICIFAVSVGLFGSVSYTMTSKNPQVRFWGCRIAAAFFFIAGVGSITSALLSTETSRAGYFWSVVMFGVAGWQWRLSTELR
jgi:hypothetical protein